MNNGANLIGGNLVLPPLDDFTFDDVSNARLFASRYRSVFRWQADAGKWLVWDKRDGVTSNDQADCELAWTNSTKPARLFSHRWMGMLKASERGQTRLHPMQKPVALIEWAMEQLSVPVDALVCDPYAGVATTAVACKRTNRRCICIEQDPGYFAKGVDRLKAEYARTALLDGVCA